MDIKLLSSENNPIIKHIKSLQLKKNRDRFNQFTIEGVRIIEQCLESRGSIEYIIYCQGLYRVRGGSQLLDRLMEKGYDIYQIPDQLFNKIAATESPQGIMALVNMKNYRLEDLDLDRNKNLFLVILDRIQDPGNMGTIIRTCESAKVDGLIITRGSVDPYNDKTIRATMGAIFYLPIIQANNKQWLDYLKQNNISLIAADLDTDKTYVDINYNKNIGIVIGNEANGIDKEILSRVDEIVSIPILGKIESLNAAIAASILIYKAVEEKYIK